MIMTAQLAEKRMQARAVYPNAVWLPGDECPIGETVVHKRLDDTLIEGVVVGEYQKDDRFKFWWLVDFKDGFEPSLLWPPTLKRPVGASEAR